MQRKTIAKGGGLNRRSSAPLRLGDHLLHIEATADGGVLRLVSSDGKQPLEIEITPAGPILRITAAVTVSIQGDLAIDAENISLTARSSLKVATRGDLTLSAGGLLTSAGRAQEIRARLGDVKIAANDDVVVDGERIKLNS